MEGTDSDSSDSSSSSDAKSPDGEAPGNGDFDNTEVAEAMHEHAAGNEDAAMAMQHHAQDNLNATDATMAMTIQNPGEMFDTDVEPNPNGLAERRYTLTK